MPLTQKQVKRIGEVYKHIPASMVELISAAAEKLADCEDLLVGMDICGTAHKIEKVLGLLLDEPVPDEKERCPNGAPHCFHMTAIYQSKPDYTELSEVCCWCGDKKQTGHGAQVRFDAAKIMAGQK